MQSFFIFGLCIFKGIKSIKKRNRLDLTRWRNGFSMMASCHAVSWLKVPYQNVTAADERKKWTGSSWIINFLINYHILYCYMLVCLCVCLWTLSTTDFRLTEFQSNSYNSNNNQISIHLIFYSSKRKERWMEWISKKKLTYLVFKWMDKNWKKKREEWKKDMIIEYLLMSNKKRNRYLERRLFENVSGSESRNGTRI